MTGASTYVERTGLGSVHVALRSWLCAAVLSSRSHRNVAVQFILKQLGLVKSKI